MIKVLVLSFVIASSIRQYECSPVGKRLETTTKDPDPIDDDSVNTPPAEDRNLVGRTGLADKKSGNAKPAVKEKSEEPNAPNSVTGSSKSKTNNITRSDSYGSVSTTPKLPFVTMDQISHNKTVELIRLINDAKVIPQNVKVFKPINLKYKNNTSQAEPVEEDHLAKNERRYVISNFDVIESYMKSRMGKEANSEANNAATQVPVRRQADTENKGLKAEDEVFSRAVHDLILLYLPHPGKHRAENAAKKNADTEKAEKAAADSPDLQVRAENFNYGDKSDDYIISTKPDVWNYEHEDWGETEKMHWDEHNNDSVHTEFDEVIEKEHKAFSHNEKYGKDKVATKKQAHDWEDHDALSKVGTLLEETGIAAKKKGKGRGSEKGKHKDELKYQNEDQPPEANQSKDQSDQDRDTQPDADSQKSGEKEGEIENSDTQKLPDRTEKPGKMKKRENKNREKADSNIPSRPGNPKITMLDSPNNHNTPSSQHRLDYPDDEPEKLQTKRQRDSRPRERPRNRENPNRPNQKRDESRYYDHNPKKNTRNEMNSADRPRERENEESQKKYSKRFSKIKRNNERENKESPRRDQGLQQRKDFGEEERRKDFDDKDPRKGFNSNDLSDKKTSDGSNNNDKKDIVGDEDLINKRSVRRPESKWSNEREERDYPKRKLRPDDYGQNDETYNKKDSKRDEYSQGAQAQNLDWGPDSREREREPENKRWKKDSRDDYKKPFREEGDRGRSNNREKKVRDEPDRYNDRHANNDWDKVGVKPSGNKYADRNVDDYERTERGDRMKNNWDSRGGGKKWDQVRMPERPRERKKNVRDGPGPGFGHTLLSFMKNKNKSVYDK